MARKKSVSRTIEQQAKQAIGSLKKDTGGFLVYNHKVLNAFLVVDNRIVGFMLDNQPSEPGEVLEHPIMDAEFMVVDSVFVSEMGEEMLEDVIDIVKAYDLHDKYEYAKRLDLFVRNGDIVISPDFQLVYIEQIPEEGFDDEVDGKGGTEQ